MKRAYSLLLTLSLLFFVYGCEPDLPPTTPGGGFYVTTWGWNQTVAAALPFPVGSITIQGEWSSDCPTQGGVGALGSPATWEQTSTLENGIASILVVNGRVCANWNIAWLTNSPFPGCAGLTGELSVPYGAPYQQTLPIACILTPAGISGSPIEISGGDGGDGGDGGPEGFTFTPDPIYNGTTTGAITATGGGFSSEYGMPLFQYFTSSGTLVAQATATYVAPSGTYASGPVPSGISSAPAGVYFGIISNATAGGSYQIIGSGTATVASGTPPSGGGGAGCRKPPCSQSTKN